MKAFEAVQKSKAKQTRIPFTATLLAAFLSLVAAATVFAAGEITECTIDGATYKKIYDVHETADGRIAIFYRVGGITVDRSELPAAFLKSWDISATAAPKPAQPDADQGSVNWFQASQAQEIEGLVRAGMIRRVGKTIYNLQKTPPGWETVTGARLVSMSHYGAVLEVPDRPANERYIAVLNFPMVQNDSAPVTAQIKLMGMEKSFVKNVGEVTLRAYDYGQVCAQSEVPYEILSSPSVADAGVAWSAGRGAAPSMAASPQNKGTGSGFFVSPDGFLLTSYHVVVKASRVAVRFGGKELPAQVKQFSRTNDLALLKVTGTGFKWLPLSTHEEPSLGERVFTIGFPNPEVQGQEPKYTEGTISGLDGLKDDPREYQMSVPVQPGNSGGPICNGRGEVLGVCRAELISSTAFLMSGTSPQNVNYAVKSKYALPLLQAADSARDYTTATAAFRVDNRENIRDRARASVAMVVVY